MRDLMEFVRLSGFPHPADVVHLFIGGSELHGAKLAGTDDTDLYGVFVERPERALGLHSLEHFVWSTAGDERRNTAQDVDVTLYSLRKWARLACKGNPTALHFLFSPQYKDGVWSHVVSHRDVFFSRRAAEQFMGFAENQLKRISGELGRGKKGQRSELEAAHGLDTKAAMHTLRLLYECLEFLRDATITLPRPELDLLVRVRAGELTLHQVREKARELLEACREAEKTSPLPEEVDRKAVSALIAQTHFLHWGLQLQMPPI